MIRTIGRWVAGVVTAGTLAAGIVFGASPALADGTCILTHYNQFIGACGGTGHLSGTGFIQGDFSSYSYWLVNDTTNKTYGPWNIGRDGARHYFVSAPAGLYEVDVVSTDTNSGTYPNYVHVHF